MRQNLYINRSIQRKEKKPVSNLKFIILRFFSVRSLKERFPAMRNKKYVKIRILLSMNTLIFYFLNLLKFYSDVQNQILYPLIISKIFFVGLTKVVTNWLSISAHWLSVCEHWLSVCEHWLSVSAHWLSVCAHWLSLHTPDYQFVHYIAV